jgi:hypothetical protein
MRVLTGRDFDTEGLAVINQQCAILGDELMPALIGVNPLTGVITSPFVRTPDIDMNGNFNGKFLSTVGDKVHCTTASLQAGTCLAVNSTTVDASAYRRHDSSGGYEGFSLLAETGDTTLTNEPGVRVYHVSPGGKYFEP